MPGFADFAGFAGVVDELYGNELVFAFSFVSSFILLHTRYMYVCDFSGLTNFSQKL